MEVYLLLMFHCLCVARLTNSEINRSVYGKEYYSKNDFDLSGSTKAKPYKFLHFWRSTGLCPPMPYSKAAEFLLSKDEKINLALIGTLPFQAISQVRVHWLLNLVTVSFSKGLTYDFRNLDKFIETLHHWNLKPGFELMGNPSGIFDNFENATQVLWWKNFVQKVAERYIEKYELEVKSWNWESWNEPDHHDFDNLNFTSKAFLNYFVASIKGVKAASSQLRFGGPGGSCSDPKFSKLCWMILEHVNNSTDLNMDFISFHSKGNEDVDSMIQEELYKISKIRKSYPNLKDATIMNDEADFQKGWWKASEWKADYRYAALVARSVTKHIYLKVKNPHTKYNLMSFDNAFLNDAPLHFFDQRTLVTRFKIRRKFNKEDSLFVKKPSYLIMGLLSLLGNRMVIPNFVPDDRRITILGTFRNYNEKHSVSHKLYFKNVKENDIFNENFDKYSVHHNMNYISSKRKTIKNFKNKIASETRDNDCRKSKKISIRSSGKINRNMNRKALHGNNEGSEELFFEFDFSSPTKIEEISLLFSISNKTMKSSDVFSITANIILPASLVNESVFIVEYSLDCDRKGPYEAWLQLDSPIEPSVEQISYIRRFERIPATKPKNVLLIANELEFKINLPLPAVKLIHICFLKKFIPPKERQLDGTL